MKTSEVLERFGDIDIPEDLAKELCRSSEQYLKMFKQLTEDILEEFNNIEIWGVLEDDIVTIKKEGNSIIVTDNYNEYCNILDIDKEYEQFLNDLAYYLLDNGDTNICNTLRESIDRKDRLKEFIKALKKEDILNTDKEVYDYIKESE